MRANNTSNIFFFLRIILAKWDLLWFFTNFKIVSFSSVKYGIGVLIVHSVQFSCSVVSDSLRPHESQHTRPPCPSPTPGIHSGSRPSSQWCHPAISSSVVPFSSCPQYIQALFQIMNHLTTITYSYILSQITYSELRESWTIKKAECQIDVFELWCWRRLESPLDCKEIKPVNPKGNQSWIFIGRTDGKAEAPIL